MWLEARTHYGVKQFVAVVQNRHGTKFMVFTTGDARYYWFQTLDQDECAVVGMAFPVRKSDLRDDIRRALAHGWGNATLGGPSAATINRRRQASRVRPDLDWL